MYMGEGVYVMWLVYVACICGLYVWLVCQYLYSMACYTCINDQKFPIWGNRMLAKLPRLFCSFHTQLKSQVSSHTTSVPSNSTQLSNFYFPFAYSKQNKPNKTTQLFYKINWVLPQLGRFISSKLPHTSQYDQQHTPAQETEDQPRVPECDADDDTVADEPVQPRQPRQPLPREAQEASANWSACSYLYNRREAGGGGDAVLGQMIAVLLVLFVLHIPKL